MSVKLTSEIINKIFKKPDIQFGLTEFEKFRPSEILHKMSKTK